MSCLCLEEMGYYTVLHLFFALNKQKNLGCVLHKFVPDTLHVSKHEDNFLKRHCLDKSSVSADVLSPLHSSYITDTRRPPAVFVGETLTGGGKAVRAFVLLSP